MGGETDLGTFEVATDPAEVAAFRAATGIEGSGVPLTYPIRWLASPEIKAALNQLVTDADLVLIHESQSFDYERPLREGERYALSVIAHREFEPDRLVAKAAVRASDGSACATVETVLRLFSTKAAAA